VDFNVNVPADLDQLGGNNSHGTVISGEGLIKLGHHPTNGWLLFNHMDQISGISKIQGGLHPGDTATYHHYGPYRLVLLLFNCHLVSPYICYWLHSTIAKVCEIFNNL